MPRVPFHTSAAGEAVGQVGRDLPPVHARSRRQRFQPTSRRAVSTSGTLGALRAISTPMPLGAGERRGRRCVVSPGWQLGHRLSFCPTGQERVGRCAADRNGNWKLHGSRQFAHELVSRVVESLPSGVEVVVLPPLPYLGDLVEDFEDHAVEFGAQDVSSNQEGAYTGEVSAKMLVDVGARFGLVGHSERRQYHNESSEHVARKFLAAVNAGLSPILCVGESLQQREAGMTEGTIASQPAVLDRSPRRRSPTPWWPRAGLPAPRPPRAGPAVHAFIRSEVAARMPKCQFAADPVRRREARQRGRAVLAAGRRRRPDRRGLAGRVRLPRDRASRGPLRQRFPEISPHAVADSTSSSCWSRSR